MIRKKYLMKFRRCQTLDTLEQVYSHMKDRIPSSELGNLKGHATIAARKSPTVNYGTKYLHQPGRTLNR